jgi:hypothetical protein
MVRLLVWSYLAVFLVMSSKQNHPEAVDIALLRETAGLQVGGIDVVHVPRHTPLGVPADDGL